MKAYLSGIIGFVIGCALGVIGVVLWVNWG
jgi:hypothetical protein